MHIKCDCGVELFDLNPKYKYICGCGNTLTGLFIQNDRTMHDDVSNKIKTVILAGRLSTFTTEELLCELDRRLSDVK